MRVQSRFLLPGLMLAFACATPSLAQVVQGSAKAVDGDTLEVAGKRVRLSGIDAPESDQTCQKDGASWACGHAATAVNGLGGGATGRMQWYRR